MTTGKKGLLFMDLVLTTLIIISVNLPTEAMLQEPEYIPDSFFQI